MLSGFIPSCKRSLSSGQTCPSIFHPSVHMPRETNGRTKDCPLFCSRTYESRAGVWGYVLAIDSEGRTIWIADAHRCDRKRYVVRGDEKLTAFLELQRAVCIHLLSEQC